MRLDHFLPFLRKQKTDQEIGLSRAVYRKLRRIVPQSWISQDTPRRLGLVRRGLRRLGRSWSSAPVRRVIQSGCFVLFLVLFFYVCWPYRAIPQQIHSGLIPAEVDGTSGQVNLIAEADLPFDVGAGDRFHLYDQSATQSAYLGEFKVVHKESRSLLLQPVNEKTPDELEALSFSLGPWQLSPYAPGAWPSHYADTFAAEDRIPAETFLIIDPLLSLSTAVANRSWVWSLGAAGVILLLCIFIPRGFCGYLCPLGTLIDIFDWTIGKRIKRFRVRNEGWWVHLKYYILLTTLLAAAGGVLISGFFAAIPVVTRGLLFTLSPLQDGFIRGWHQVPAINGGQVLSIALFLIVLALGLLRPRFWCKYVCPSGAVFSLGNLFRVSERKVESSCIHCNQCIEVCPFDAIKPDFTTRTTDCTNCQTCGGVCPSHSIKFVDRWDITNLKQVNDPPTGESAIGRRGFLAAGIGTAGSLVAAAATTWTIKATNRSLPANALPVRPPGSVPETDFLELCIRCGECFKVCPNNVLQAEGFKQGWEGLWTPEVVADWAGCEPSCNACGQVCPTGAIRALPIEEKRHARMGLAIVNRETCLPLAGREACQLCVDECTAAGYDAIEFVRVHTQLDENGRPIPGTGFLAPNVRAESCVGCGLCQTRCYSVNKKDKGLLAESAIVIQTGADWEDRIREGSYVELAIERAKAIQNEPEPSDKSDYLPDFLLPANSDNSK